MTQLLIMHLTELNVADNVRLWQGMPPQFFPCAVTRSTETAASLFLLILTSPVLELILFVGGNTGAQRITFAHQLKHFKASGELFDESRK